MTGGASIVNDYLYRIRQQFYPDNEKAFYQQRRLLIRAISFPAGWLDRRGIVFPEKRYRQLLDEILKGIMHHGNTGNIGYFAGYLFSCIQQHMKHHEEEYYDLGKSLRSKNDQSMKQILSGLKVDEPAADAATVESLAAYSRLTKSGPRRGKKTKPDGDQMTLFK